MALVRLPTKSWHAPTSTLALGCHLMNKHVKDVAQDVAQDLAQDVAEDMAEDVTQDDSRSLSPQRPRPSTPE